MAFTCCEEIKVKCLFSHLFCLFFLQVIEQQKRAYFEENPIEDADKTEIDENDDRSYDSPQIFLHQLFKLYRKGLIDDRNIRDQVYLMVYIHVFFLYLVVVILRLAF